MYISRWMQATADAQGLSFAESGSAFFKRKQQYVKLKCRSETGKTIEIVCLKYSYRNFKMKAVVILKVSVLNR